MHSKRQLLMNMTLTLDDADMSEDSFNMSEDSGDNDIIDTYSDITVADPAQVLAENDGPGTHVVHPAEVVHGIPNNVVGDTNAYDANDTSCDPIPGLELIPGVEQLQEKLMRTDISSEVRRSSRENKYDGAYTSHTSKVSPSHSSGTAAK